MFGGKGVSDGKRIRCGKAVAMSAGLSGLRVAVAVTGGALGGRLAAGLAGRGARVAFVCDHSGRAQGDWDCIVADFSSRADLDRAFGEADARLEGIDLVIHAALPDLMMKSQVIGEMEDEHWEAACEAALEASLHCLQAAHASLARRAGMVIQLGPAPALVGASGLVPLCTAAEAQRGLAKSAARQWGADGIRVNWISLAAEVLSPLLATADLAKKSEAIPIPLGRRPDVENDVIAMVESWVGAAGKHLTGVSLNLDGGEWMLP